MKIGLSWLNQIRSDVNVGGFTAETFDSLVAQIAASYHMEHTVDDKHATIHASGSIAERGRTVAQGVWVPVPYLAGNFTAVGATWTVLGGTFTSGQARVFQYMLIGTTMWVSWYLETTTLSAAVVPLTIGIPCPAIVNAQAFGALCYDDNGVTGNGVAQARRPPVGANGIFIDLYKDIRGNATWGNSANLTIAGQIALDFTGTF